MKLSFYAVFENDNISPIDIFLANTREVSNMKHCSPRGTALLFTCRRSKGLKVGFC